MEAPLVEFCFELVPPDKELFLAVVLADEFERVLVPLKFDSVGEPSFLFASFGGGLLFPDQLKNEVEVDVHLQHHSLVVCLSKIL